MDRLTWDDRFSVGIEELDGHHRRLAELINELADNVNAPTRSEAVTDILSALSDYAAYHFEREEALLHHQQYPGLDDHVREHNMFCEIVADACFQAACHSLNLQSLLDYLFGWWSDHILRVDYQYKAFLQGKDVS